MKKKAIVVSEYENIEQSLFEDENSLIAANFITKAKNKNQYILHTLLLNYSGKDENIIYNCYWHCLELAKNFNLYSITFLFKLCLMSGLQMALNATVNAWFKENENYKFWN